MSEEVLNIVVLGGSFSGISFAHNFLTRTLPDITRDNKFSYRLIIVSPSTHLYWNISAPRAIVSSKLIPHDQSFLPFVSSFDRYSPGSFQHILGTATSLDTKARKVKISCERVADSYDDIERGANSNPPALSTKASAVVNATVNSISSVTSPTSSIGSPRHERDPLAWGPFAPTSTNSSPGTSEIELKYHALVLATGSTAHSPLLSLRGPHENTKASLDTFHSKLPTADTICISGGGPSGVETAGQLAYFLNKKYGNLPHQTPRSYIPTPWNILSYLRTSARIHSHPKNIILLAGSERLLPKLHPSLGIKAKRKLEEMGVRVILDVRVWGATVAGASGKTTLKLSNESTMSCDLYIPCTGVTPNTQYLPRDSPLLRNGYIATDPTPSTLRVQIPQHMLPPTDQDLVDAEVILGKADIAIIGGDADINHGGANMPTATNYARVYAVGDVADYSTNSILDIYTAVPVLLHNLTNDLIIHQLVVQNPYGGNNERIAELQENDEVFVRDERDSQICPIGARPNPGGVGVVFGWRIPSLIVWLFKGKTYVVDKGPQAVDRGVCPYPEG